MAKPSTLLDKPKQAAMKLDYNEDGISFNSNRANGAIDKAGRTIPAERLPDTLASEGIAFSMGPTKEGQSNMLACRGQTISLPEGQFTRLYLLAAAQEETEGKFVIGGQSQSLRIQCWTGLIGQYDNRIWDRKFDKVDYVGAGKVVGIKTGYIKRDNIAWFCSHRHTPTGDDAYQFSYLFKYTLDIPQGAKSIILPDNPSIKIFAMTAADNENDQSIPLQPLYDNFDNRKSLSLRNP
jgi:alpha-mannosidase